jgi:hypothetical protein
MAAIVQKDWKTAHELIRWWHNTPKQVAGSEIDMAIICAWEAAMKHVEALKPSHNKCKPSIGQVAPTPFLHRETCELSNVCKYFDSECISNDGNEWSNCRHYKHQQRKDKNGTQEV